MPNKNSSKRSQKKTPAKKAASGKEKTQHGWEWALFTRKSVAFNKVAKELADALKSAYGDNVSISQFEKMVAAFPSMSDAEKQLIYINNDILELLKKYRAARALRDEERDNFRGDIKIGDVNTGMDAITSYALLQADLPIEGDDDSNKESDGDY